MDIVFGPMRDETIDEDGLVQGHCRAQTVIAAWWHGDVYHYKRLGRVKYPYGPCPNRGENGYDGTVHTQFIPVPAIVRFEGLAVDWEPGAREIIDVRLEGFSVGPLGPKRLVTVMLHGQICNAHE